MNRRTFVRSAALTLSAISLFKGSALAALLNDPAYKIRMLTDDCGIFTERGGTILFMITKKGIVVVDSQFPDSAAHLVEDLKKRSMQPFKYLINTHHHRDHTSGNILFTGIVEHVVAHQNSKANQERQARSSNDYDKHLYPTVTFDDSWSRKLDGRKIKLHYFGAAHTNGDSLVHFENQDVIHMGDLVFNRRHPVIDKTNGANIANWMKVLEKAVSKFGKDTRYVCGHAREGHDVVVKSDDVLLFRDYLGNLLNFMDKEIKAGKTRPEILKATTIPGSPEWMGDGINRPLEAAYTELTANFK